MIHNIIYRTHRDPMSVFTLGTTTKYQSTYPATFFAFSGENHPPKSFYTHEQTIQPNHILVLDHPFFIEWSEENLRRIKSIQVCMREKSSPILRCLYRIPVDSCSKYKQVVPIHQTVSRYHYLIYTIPAVFFDIKIKSEKTPVTTSMDRLITIELNPSFSSLHMIINHPDHRRTQITCNMVKTYQEIIQRGYDSTLLLSYNDDNNISRNDRIQMMEEDDTYETLFALKHATGQIRKSESLLSLPAIQSCYHIVPCDSPSTSGFRALIVYSTRHQTVPLWCSADENELEILPGGWISYSPDQWSHMEWDPERIQSISIQGIMNIGIGEIGSPLCMSPNAIDPSHIEPIQVHECTYSPSHPNIPPKICSTRTIQCLNLNRFVSVGNYLEIHLKPNQVPFATIRSQDSGKMFSTIIMRSKLIGSDMNTIYPRKRVERMVNKIKKRYLERTYRFQEIHPHLSPYLSEDIIQHILLPYVGTYPKPFFPVRSPCLSCSPSSPSSPPQQQSWMSQAADTIISYLKKIFSIVMFKPD